MSGQIKYVTDTVGDAIQQISISGKSGSAIFNNVSVTSDGELIIGTLEKEANVLSSYTKNNISSSTTSFAVLVDLSNIINFPHNGTQSIRISYVASQVDRDNTSTGRVALGVVTRIDSGSADISMISSLSFVNASTTYLLREENFNPSLVNCFVSGGITPNIVTSHKYLNITSLNTSSLIDSFLGTSSIIPAIGDILIRYERSAGTYDAYMKILYHST